MSDWGMQVYFKTNKYFIREKPNLKNYVRDLYQIPGRASAASCLQNSKP